MVDRANVIISDTRLEAILRVVSVEEPEELDLTMILSLSGVTHSLSGSRIRELQDSLSDPSFTCEVEISKGLPPTDSVDGVLELLFESGPIPGQLLGDGQIDFHERLTLAPAREGATIARYLAPKEGQPGVDVLGQEIRARKPHDPLPRLGKGVAVSKDGQVTAARSGHVVYIESKSLDVDVCFEHRGAVGMASGNLRSEGSLVVNGDVESGYKVEAGAAVLISGHLNSGESKAGAAMSVGGCIYGHAESSLGVIAGEGVAAKNALGARIETLGKIIIEKDAVDCEFWCEHAVIGDGKNGRFRGGEAVASHSFTATETGSQAGVATRISVGRPWVVERQIKQWERRHATDDHRFARNKAKNGERSKGGKVSRAQSKKQAGLTSLRVQMRRASRSLLEEAFIEIGRAHGGTTLAFGRLEFGIFEETLNRRFRFDAVEQKIIAEEL